MENLHQYQTNKLGLDVIVTWNSIYANLYPGVTNFLLKLGLEFNRPEPSLRKQSEGLIFYFALKIHP